MRMEPAKLRGETGDERDGGIGLSQTDGGQLASKRGKGGPLIVALRSCRGANSIEAG